MYDNKLSIKDYVTLLLTDADENPEDGVYTWNIPTTYYTNQRSNVCTVSIVGCNLQTVASQATLVINYVNGASNIYSKDNQTYLIGHCEYHADHGTHGAYTIIDRQINLLTTARPNKITLEFLNDNLVLNDMATGIVTLEFCYYNAEETNDNLHNQYTNTLK